MLPLSQNYEKAVGKLEVYLFTDVVVGSSMDGRILHIICKDIQQLELIRACFHLPPFSHQLVVVADLEHRNDTLRKTHVLI